MTIRTSILEMRAICGTQALADELERRFETEVVTNSGPEFIAAKLAERDQRHRKAGDTRYLVEPNVKEGKGGLRDLHTLFWIAKYYYHVRDTAELVKLGVLSKRELKLCEKADDFLWTVRCQMHFITGKAEERLSFDIQREIAASLNYQPRPGLSAVERFMKHYFLVAKDVGDLTRILCAALEDKQAKDVPGLSGVFSRFAHRLRKIPGSDEFCGRSRSHRIGQCRCISHRSGQHHQAVSCGRYQQSGTASRCAARRQPFAGFDQPRASRQRRGEPAISGDPHLAARSGFDIAAHE